MFQQYVNKNVVNGAVIYAAAWNGDFGLFGDELYKDNAVFPKAQGKAKVYPISKNVIMTTDEWWEKAEIGDYIIIEKPFGDIPIAMLSVLKKQAFEENYEPLPVSAATNECSAPKDDSFERGDEYIVEYKKIEQAMPSHKHLTNITNVLSEEHGITFMSEGKLKWFVRYEHLIAFGLAEEGAAK